MDVDGRPDVIAVFFFIIIIIISGGGGGRVLPSEC